MFKKIDPWILHPFFIGSYAVLALLAHNVSQLSLFSALRSLFFALALGGVLWGIFALATKDRYRAALAASFTLILLFSYGHIYFLVEDIHFLGVNIGRHRVLAPVLLVVYLVGLWGISRWQDKEHRGTSYVNLISLLMTVIPLVQIGYYEVRPVVIPQGPGANPAVLSTAGFHLQDGETAPDIYYIILDTYTRQDALQEVFNFDNSTFLSALVERGFYIGSCSQSNYSFTAASFASSLNMEYLDTLGDQFSPPNTNVEDLFPLIQDSAVRQALEGLGYEIVAFESGYSLTELREADAYLSPQDDTLREYLVGGLNPFEAMLFQTTVGDLLYAMHAFPTGIQNSLFDYAYLIYRNRILYEFDQLGRVQLLPGPKFVLVHILAPHNPFVFDANGGFVSRTTPFTLNGDIDALRYPDYARGYADQVAYLNTRALESIDAILANSTTPPVIILQGDHGSPRYIGWSTTILNAYYLPAAPARSMLYPSISPVNTFRVVFNGYFGADLPLLSDRAYRSTVEAPFDFSLETDPNPACLAP